MDARLPLPEPIAAAHAIREALLESVASVLRSVADGGVPPPAGLAAELPSVVAALEAHKASGERLEHETARLLAQDEELGALPGVEPTLRRELSRRAMPVEPAAEATVLPQPRRGSVDVGLQTVAVRGWQSGGRDTASPTPAAPPTFPRPSLDARAHGDATPRGVDVDAAAAMSTSPASRGGAAHLSVSFTVDDLPAVGAARAGADTPAAGGSRGDVAGGTIGRSEAVARATAAAAGVPTTPPPSSLLSPVSSPSGTQVSPGAAVSFRVHSPLGSSTAAAAVVAGAGVTSAGSPGGAGGAPASQTASSPTARDRGAATPAPAPAVTLADMTAAAGAAAVALLAEPPQPPRPALPSPRVGAPAATRGAAAAVGAAAEPHAQRRPPVAPTLSDADAAVQPASGGAGGHGIEATRGDGALGSAAPIVPVVVAPDSAEAHATHIRSGVGSSDGAHGAARARPSATSLQHRRGLGDERPPSAGGRGALRAGLGDETALEEAIAGGGGRVSRAAHRRRHAATPRGASRSPSRSTSPARSSGAAAPPVAAQGARHILSGAAAPPVRSAAAVTTTTSPTVRAAGVRESAGADGQRPPQRRMSGATQPRPPSRSLLAPTGRLRSGKGSVATTGGDGGGGGVGAGPSVSPTVSRPIWRSAMLPPRYAERWRSNCTGAKYVTGESGDIFGSTHGWEAARGRRGHAGSDGSGSADASPSSATLGGGSTGTRYARGGRVSDRFGVAGGGDVTTDAGAVARRWRRVEVDGSDGADDGDAGGRWLHPAAQPPLAPAAAGAPFVPPAGEIGAPPSLRGASASPPSLVSRCGVHFADAGRLTQPGRDASDGWAAAMLVPDAEKPSVGVQTVDDVADGGAAAAWDDTAAEAAQLPPPPPWYPAGVLSPSMPRAESGGAVALTHGVGSRAVPQSVRGTARDDALLPSAAAAAASLPSARESSASQPRLRRAANAARSASPAGRRRVAGASLAWSAAERAATLLRRRRGDGAGHRATSQGGRGRSLRPAIAADAAAAASAAVEEVSWTPRGGWSCPSYVYPRPAPPAASAVTGALATDAPRHGARGHGFPLAAGAGGVVSRPRPSGYDDVVRFCDDDGGVGGYGNYGVRWAAGSVPAVPWSAAPRDRPRRHDRLSSPPSPPAAADGDDGRPRDAPRTLASPPDAPASAASSPLRLGALSDAHGARRARGRRRGTGSPSVHARHLVAHHVLGGRDARGSFSDDGFFGDVRGAVDRSTDAGGAVSAAAAAAAAAVAAARSPPAAVGRRAPPLSPARSGDWSEVLSSVPWSPSLGGGAGAADDATERLTALPDGSGDVTTAGAAAGDGAPSGRGHAAIVEALARSATAARGARRQWPSPPPAGASPFESLRPRGTADSLATAAAALARRPYAAVTRALLSGLR